MQSIFGRAAKGLRDYKHRREVDAAGEIIDICDEALEADQSLEEARRRKFQTFADPYATDPEKVEAADAVNQALKRVRDVEARLSEAKRYARKIAPERFNF